MYCGMYLKMDHVCSFVKSGIFRFFFFLQLTSIQKMPPADQEATQEILYLGVRDPMFYSTRKHMFLLLIKSDMIRHSYSPFYRYVGTKKGSRSLGSLPLLWSG